MMDQQEYEYTCAKLRSDYLRETNVRRVEFETAKGELRLLLANLQRVHSVQRTEMAQKARVFNYTASTYLESREQLDTEFIAERARLQSQMSAMCAEHYAFLAAKRAEYLKKKTAAQALYQEWCAARREQKAAASVAHLENIAEQAAAAAEEGGEA